MKMKIAVWHNLPSGGGKRALYYHVRGLVERGHFVQVWCPPTSNRKYLPLGDLITEHVVPLDVRPSRASRLLPRTEMLRNELYTTMLDEIRAQDEHCRKCADEINREGYDLLFANSSSIQGVAPIGRYVKTAKVLYLQEPNRALYEARSNGLRWVAISSLKRPWMKPRYVNWFLSNLLGVQQLRIAAREELMNAQAFDRILVNSFFSRESLLRAYGLDSTVCYLGVDNQLFVDLSLPREGFVVSLGAIYPHKNVEFIIRAIGEIAPPRPRLIWIGNLRSEGYSEQMQRLAKSSGVSFETRTNIGDSELVEMLNRASVMAYAPRLEPFGFAPLEANACGLPVVATAEGGMRETVIDGVNGLLVPYDPRAMAAALERLLRDKEYAEQLGSNGAQIVAEKWSLDASVTRLEDQLTEVVARASQGVSGSRPGAEPVN